MEKAKEYLCMLKEHKNIVRTAAIISIVIVAAVFFGQKEEKDEIPVQFEDEVAVSEEDTEEEEPAADEETEPASAEQKIYVDISGQVENPGVYIVSDGTRLFEVIEKAGGLLKDAEMNQINRAEIVTDGQKIIIPAKGEEIAVSGGGTPSGGLININTADSTALQEIPGVGPATAEKIIAYRTENGRFATKEDIKNVSGIGDKTYEKMKDKITV